MRKKKKKNLAPKVFTKTHLRFYISVIEKLQR